MKVTQQHHSVSIFTYIFILVITVLLLLLFPFIQQMLEQFNQFMGNLLNDFQHEISRSYGR